VEVEDFVCVHLRFSLISSFEMAQLAPINELILSNCHLIFFHYRKFCSKIAATNKQKYQKSHSKIYFFVFHRTKSHRFGWSV